MKVFIMGGEGFVGSAFVRQCEARKLDWEAVELGNYERFKGQSCDLLVNAAGNSKKYLANEDPVRDFDYSLKALLRSFEDFQFSSYVYISSIDVYSDHSHPEKNREDAEIDISALSHYGFHKFLGENMVRHHLSRWLILRLGGVLGPGLKKNPVYDLLHDVPLRVNEESRYGYIATDTAAAFVLDLAETDRENEIFNCCGTGTVSIREIREWLKKPLRYHGEALPVERYEINNGKLRSLFDVPESRPTARRFIDSFENEN